MQKTQSASNVVFPPYEGSQGKGGFPGSPFCFMVRLMRLLIADGHARVRHALSVLLQEQAGWTVVGTAASLEELAQRLPACRPDILLLDWDLPGGPLDRVAVVLRRCFPDLTIVIMSVHPEVIQRARDLDIGLCFSKTDSPERLLSLIRAGNLPQKQNPPGHKQYGLLRN
jgi:DNA-binding response OmpR family regulator